MLRAGFARLSGALSSAHLISGEAHVHEKVLEKSKAYSNSAETDENSPSNGLNMTDMCDNRVFDFARMVSAFEAVTFPLDASILRQRGGLPHTSCFLDAMSEVILLFDHLGSAFAFVRRDIHAKTSILRTYAADRPPRFVDLESAVHAEVAEGVANAKPPPSAARTLLRLMWALKFIDTLLGHLRDATRTDSRMPSAQRTLRAAVSVAYEKALAEHHSWALRKTVRAALSLLPSQETFIEKVGARPAYLERLERSMTPIVNAMYKFYEKEQLLNLA